MGQLSKQADGPAHGLLILWGLRSLVLPPKQNPWLHGDLQLHQTPGLVRWWDD